MTPLADLISPLDAQLANASSRSPVPTSHLTPEERQRMLKAWKDTLRYPNAAQPEIIRADQRDIYFIANLQDILESSLRGFVGARWLTARSNDLRDVGRLLYYLLTTLSGSQTLGEEYCDIIQFDAATRNCPSLKRRALCIFAQIYSPRILSSVYSRLRSRLCPVEQDSNLIEDETRTSSRFGPIKSTLLDWLSLLPATFDLTTYHTIGSIHLAVFYLTGRYFHWSKRLTRIRYLSTQLRPLQDESGARVQPPSYEFLGLLMVIQLIVRFTISLKNAQTRRQTAQFVKETEKLSMAGFSRHSKGKETAEDQDEMPPDRPPTVDSISIDSILFEPEADSAGADDPDNSSDIRGVLVQGVESDPISDDSTARRCTLCLGPKIDQVSLECGHVFCWRCVVGWVREKPECPLCRQAVKTTDLLPLYNF